LPTTLRITRPRLGQILRPIDERVPPIAGVGQTHHAHPIVVPTPPCVPGAAGGASDRRQRMWRPTRCTPVQSARQRNRYGDRISLPETHPVAIGVAEYVAMNRTRLRRCHSHRTIGIRAGQHTLTAQAPLTHRSPRGAGADHLTATVRTNLAEVGMNKRAQFGDLVFTEACSMVHAAADRLSGERVCRNSIFPKFSPSPYSPPRWESTRNGA
jgi:hypothetical protein